MDRPSLLIENNRLKYIKHYLEQQLLDINMQLQINTNSLLAINNDIIQSKTNNSITIFKTRR